MLFYIRRLKKRGANENDIALREKSGALSGIVGICLNLLLFAGKLIVALASGSVAIYADSFNNLGDAGSSIITLVGFKLSGKKPDPQHPFGHGRLEYITGLIVSFAILMMGFELGMSSIKSISNPQPVTYSVLTVIILCSSIVVKLYMAVYNKKLSELFKSPAMKAICIDSLSDTIATFSVLASLIIAKLTNVQLDSYAGIVISLFILYSGIKSVQETIRPLLGAPPSDDLVESIKHIVMQHPTIVGMHDLVVHDYGPGRLMISLHAEVPSDIDVFRAHCIIDDMENELNEKLNCEAVIHFDPVDVNDDELKRLKESVSCILNNIDERLSLHDFRSIPGDSHTNLIFDVVLPYDVKVSENEIRKRISTEVSNEMPYHNCIIKFDNSFTK